MTHPRASLGASLAALAAAILMAPSPHARAQTQTQIQTQSPPAPGYNPSVPPPDVLFKRPNNDIGTGQSLPLSNNSSNINGADTRSLIAPRLPAPPLSEDSPPAAFLQAARAALAAGQTGAAQESLERAETRTLDRSVAYGATNNPSGQTLVQQITAALQALASGDPAATMRAIDTALANPDSQRG